MPEGQLIIVMAGGMAAMALEPDGSYVLISLSKSPTPWWLSIQISEYWEANHHSRSKRVLGNS